MLIPFRGFGLLTWVKQPQEQRYPFLPVCIVFSFLYRLPLPGIFNMHKMGLYEQHKSLHWKLALGGKKPCHIGESNLCQYYAWLFLLIFCQLSYHPPKCFPIVVVVVFVCFFCLLLHLCMFSFSRGKRFSVCILKHVLMSVLSNCWIYTKSIFNYIFFPLRFQYLKRKLQDDKSS